MPFDAAVWLAIVVTWLAVEIYSLRRDTDDVRPFTYWVRRTLSLHRGPFAIGWWLSLGLISWLAWHFLVEGVFLT